MTYPEALEALTNSLKAPTGFTSISGQIACIFADTTSPTGKRALTVSMDRDGNIIASCKPKYVPPATPDPTATAAK